MAKIDAKIIEWNKAPYSPDNKIPKEIRDALCVRFEVAISNLRDTDVLNELLLKDGWVIRAKNDISFVLNPIKDENLPDNTVLNGEECDAGKLGAQLRKFRDEAWDCEKYSDLAKLAGFTLDSNTGKITYKVL